MQEEINYQFQYKVSKEVLCNYLARTLTICSTAVKLGCEKSDYRKRFILNTGAKYIQRAETSWLPCIEDYNSYESQKAFIDDIHTYDSDIVFEACIFECVSILVDEIPIPEWVFEAFDKEPEKRNFSFEKMCFPDKKYYNMWCENSTVPDMTQLETQMFFYYRACKFISLGFEALHLGQVHLIGENDTDWKCWTKLLKMIREYATKYARRNFVFINSHTGGIIGSDGVLLFDFHADPCRPMADGTQEPHFPTEDNPQRCYLTNRQRGDFRTIYGKSIGGKTYSGWECDSLPYLVEIDNYEDDYDKLNIPDPEDVRCWGMDEINWFANQPAWYRAEFLKYAYNWVKNEAIGEGFLSLPGERKVTYYNENKEAVEHGYYYAYYPENFEKGTGDEAVIKEIFSQN